MMSLRVVAARLPRLKGFAFFGTNEKPIMISDHFKESHKETMRRPILTIFVALFQLLLLLNVENIRGSIGTDGNCTLVAFVPFTVGG